MTRSGLEQPPIKRENDSAGTTDPGQPGELATRTIPPTEPVPADPQVTANYPGASTTDQDAGARRERAAAPAKLPRIEGYEILAVLGRGGMGVVYKARQVGLNRLVALKMILAGEHAGDDDLGRFRAEAEAVARLHHPHIVQIHEVGQADGYPFFSLEFVDGGSLERILQGKPQPPREAARLIQTLAGAMQYAHEHGVVHRDLKPANILLSREEATASQSSVSASSGRTSVSARIRATTTTSYGVPKIADFGLAKQLDDHSGRTQSGTVIGTASYMAPEQALGQIRAMGPAVDVYALGAILYEMLTGRPPFRGATMFDTLDQVKHREPVPPAQLQPKVPRDLETICLKALDKTAARRYASAGELEDDLERFLTDQPILARPVGHVERLWRWCRRNPGIALLTGGIALALVAGSIVSTYFAIRATRGEQAALANEQIALANEKTALERKDESERRRYVAEFRLAVQKWKDGQIDEVRQILTSLTPKGDDPDLRSFEWHYLQRLCQLELRTLTGHGKSVLTVACSPDGRWIASASVDKTARIWERATGRLVHTLTSSDEVDCVAFSPDSKTLAWGGKDKIIHLVEVATGTERAALTGHTDSVRALAYRPDGAELASVSYDKTARLWNLTTHESRVLPDQLGSLTNLVYGPEGKTLYSAGREAGILIWDVKTGQQQGVLAGYEGKTTLVTGSSAGRRLASYGQDQLIRIWDATANQQVTFLHPAMEKVNSIALSPDGTRVAATGEDRTVRVWNVDTGKLVLTLRGHWAMGFGVTFSADGWQLVSAGGDSTVKIWDAAEPHELLRLRTANIAARGVVFIDGGPQVASCESGGTIRLWDSDTGMHLKTLSGHRDGTSGVCWMPKLQRLASVGQDGVVRLWAVESGAEVEQLSGANQPLTCCAASRDGRLLAGYARDGTVFVWDLSTRSIVHRFPTRSKSIHGLAFHPNGRFLAAASDEQPVTTWDLKTGAAVSLVEEEKDPGCCVAFSVDGRQMVIGDDVALWNLETRKKRLTLRPDVYAKFGVTFNPDGRRVAAVTVDPLVRLWDTATGLELLALPGHTARGRSVAISGDGLCLASVSDDGFLQIWNARPLTFERLELREAASLVRFLLARSSDRDEILRRIADQPGITDAVRERAREIAKGARIEPVGPGAR